MRKSIFYLTCFLFVFVSLGTSCNGQSSNPYSANKIKAAKIEEIIQLYTDYGGFNGSALVSFEGEIIYQNGFGFANMEWDIPNTVESKFRIASITKPFTAILIMQLVANNTLELNAPISNYLPDYPKENGDKITIHHLLTHSSGISRDSGFDRPINQYPDRAQTEQLVNEFSNQPLEFNPGEKYSYSNSGYMLLAYLIETVSGKSYEAMLEEHIFDIVGMKNSGCDKHRPIIKHRTDGYFESYGNHYNANYIDMSTITGVGNIYSTVGDLFLLDQALYTDILLPKKYRDLMFSQKIEDKESGGFDGYGWQLGLKPIGNTSEKIATIGHSGVIDGFCAIFTRIPSSNSSIISRTL